MRRIAGRATTRGGFAVEVRRARDALLEASILLDTEDEGHTAIGARMSLE